METGYQAFGEWKENPDIGKYYTWSIRCGSCEERKDISTNKGLVEQLAERFNRQSLSRHHFGDAIEDWLARS